MTRNEAAERLDVDEWLARPETVQVFANALAAWPPTAKPGEYVAAWRHTLATLLISEVRARLTSESPKFVNSDWPPEPSGDER